MPNENCCEAELRAENREGRAESNSELERNRLSFPAHRVWVIRQFDICRLRSIRGACDIRRALDLVLAGV
jgi:hypothetical protein